MIRRIKQDFSNITINPPENISVGLVNDNLRHWVATIIGPNDSPYKGGIFSLDITFPQDYPYGPPKIKFKTRVYHPNINSSGSICLDILKNQWSPALTMEKTLLSICSLLTTPNPDDPLDSDAARLYKLDRAGYNIKVAEYVRRYASGNNFDKIKKDDI